MNRAVFLDRDGVLNEPCLRDGLPYPPPTLAELKIYPDAATALRRLKDAGYLLIVVTNQPDVARGAQDREVVDSINGAIGAELPIDEFSVCFHDDRDKCDCRKPKPGLLMAAAQRWNIDMKRSFMIGDRWRDIDAGAAAGCSTILIDRGYPERPPQHPPGYVTTDLNAAAGTILRLSALQSITL